MHAEIDAQLDDLTAVPRSYQPGLKHARPEVRAAQSGIDVLVHGDGKPPFSGWPGRSPCLGHRPRLL
jgi:hypothetical protein